MNKYIAEIGWNFLGDLDLAKKMVEAAATAGANVIKFQYWNPDNLTEGAWDEDGRREIYEKAYLTKDKISKLEDMVAQNNCDFLLSVFSLEGAKYINSLGLRSVKIPSHESYNLGLIDYCLQNFESIYISVGACTEQELKQVLDLTENSQKNICLLHCVSSYPLDNSNANLKRVGILKSLTKHTVGYSDHTESLLAPSIAIAQGACVIEKHFTIDHDLPGRDNKFALDGPAFEEMMGFCLQTEDLLTWKGMSFQNIESDVVANYRGRWAKESDI